MFEVRFGETPKPVPETGALPGTSHSLTVIFESGEWNPEKNEQAERLLLVLVASWKLALLSLTAKRKLSIHQS